MLRIRRRIAGYYLPMVASWLSGTVGESISPIQPSPYTGGRWVVTRV